MKRLAAIVSILSALLGVAGLAIPNPLRAYFPEMFGLVCDANRLCVEDAWQFDGASALASPALTYVAKKLGEFKTRPTMIFCRTEACYNMFGRRRSASAAFGDKAVLIGPRGWQPYYVRHELVHIAQYQRLGVLRAWRAPQWLREGMAYSLSDDPRRPLPGEPEVWRAEFERCCAGEEGEALWAKVRKALRTDE